MPKNEISMNLPVIYIESHLTSTVPLTRYLNSITRPHSSRAQELYSMTHEIVQ